MRNPFDCIGSVPMDRSLSGPNPGGTVEDFLADDPGDQAEDGDHDEDEGEEADADLDDPYVDPGEELLPEPPRGGSWSRGRQGLRNGSDGSSSHQSATRRPAGIRLPTPKDDGKARAQRKPRGNLPPAPVFDGDRRKDAKCFRKYASKVDSYVEIAKNIIDDSEIGLRLHAALEGEAADFLEDIPAKTFGVEAGWQVLLKLLQDKYDEKRMHKVGSAMKGFFKLNLGDRQYTMMETAEAMDKAARRCREANLTIPDEIMIYFFFEHAQLSTERQANLLLRTSGEYDWKKMKQAVELLYQNTPVRSGPPNNPQGHRGRTRATHEMHADTTDLWRRQPDWSASEEQWGNWLQDYDPVESLFDTDFEEIPEDIARELHSCYQTHRENRQRLAKAVQARGFYVGSASKGKGRGKGDSKGKGKTKGKKGDGRARGMSLDELKAKTTCAACGQLGHWKGDPQCRAKSANEASRAEAEGVEDDEGDWYGEYSSDQWATWESERYGYSDDRMAYTIHRTPTAPLASPTARSSAERPQEAELEHESRAVARGINRVRSKAGTEAGAVDASRVKEEIKTDNFMRVEAIKAQIKEARAPTMSPSPAPEAVKRAFEQLGVTMAVLSGSSVLELLEKKSPAVDVDTLRKAMMVHKPFRHVLLEELTGSPRTVLSNMRRQPTVETGRIYLTLDTACENTVAGTTILQEITVNLQEKHNLQPIIEPESETYCFGPGEPVTSVERWFVPAGIQGAHSVICTSSIQDKAGAKIPFLAGQDWMVFVDACIDIGRNEAMLRELGVTAPLFVDFTGHLVIAIDEITDWRPGVYAFKTGYPGRLFECTSRQVQESSAASKDQAGAEGNAFDSGEFSQHFAPTHMYEPKHSAEQAKLCCVPADMWEFMFENQVYVRHHRRPRCDLFVPEVFSDGPDPRDLQDIRVTLLSNEAEPIIDSWRGVSNKVREPWVGVTYFFGKQAKNLSKIDLLRPAVKVQVTLSDGDVLHAEPNELRALPQKKVHHFDLTVANKLDYQHARHLDIPQSRRKGNFEIPFGEFGSEQQRPRTTPGAAPHASFLGAIQPEGTMPGLGPPGADPRGDDAAGGRPRALHRGDAVGQASVALGDGVHCGGDDDGARADIDARRRATGDDDSSGTDEEDDHRRLPERQGVLQPPPGRGPADGECAWAVHGVPVVREDVEGGPVPGPAHGGDDAYLRDPPRTSCGARRPHQQEGGRGRTRTGKFSKVAGLLCVALAALMGNGSENYVQPFLDINSEEPFYEAQGGEELRGGFEWQDGWPDGGRAGAGRGPEAAPHRGARENHAAGGTTSRGQATSSSTGGPRTRRESQGAVPERNGGEDQQGGVRGERGQPERLFGRPGDLGHGEVEVEDGPRPLRKGQVRRMQNHARAALKADRLHRDGVVDRLGRSRWPRRAFRFDVVEVLGGSSMVSVRAAFQWGLRVLQPIDLRCGLDFRRSADQGWLLDTLEKFNARLVVVEFPCTTMRSLVKGEGTAGDFEDRDRASSGWRRGSSQDNVDEEAMPLPRSPRCWRTTTTTSSTTSVTATMRPQATSTCERW